MLVHRTWRIQPEVPHALPHAALLPGKTVDRTHSAVRAGSASVIG